MKKSNNPPLIFVSSLSPQTFIEQAHDTVIQENYPYFSYINNCFIFQINANHGGKVFFQCEISPNEKGSSIIKGTILYQSWKDDTQTLLDKIRDTIIIVLTCVVFFPVFIFIGIYDLILRLSKKKRLSPDEKKAIEFMKNKLYCSQITTPNGD